MKRNYKLAIFDLDGTVLDTLGDLHASVNAALRGSALSERSVEEIRVFLGNGMKNLIDRSVPSGTDEALTARVLADFKAHYAVHSTDTTAPYEGVPHMLGALRAAGVKTAVLSNKADDATKALCRTYFEGCFDLALGERESEGIAKKPAPDAVFDIMSAFGVTVDETVYIGDSEVDVMTARNAGVSLLSVTWGFRTPAVLRAAGAKARQQYGAQQQGKRLFHFKTSFVFLIANLGNFGHFQYTTPKETRQVNIV